MSGIGFSELVILALIGLIVLGPERLPRVANQLGGWLGQARRMTRVMKRQLEDELNLEKNFGMDSPPVSREPSHQPAYTPPREDDDYSPAHGADDAGTGVGDDLYDDDSDLAVRTADLAGADADNNSDADDAPKESSS